MDWQDEPATQHQLRLLEEFGFQPTTQLTLTEAARLIRQYHRNPHGPVPAPADSGMASAAPQKASATSHSAAGVHPAGLPVQPQEISESARMHVHRLRQEVVQARATYVVSPEGANVRADMFARTTSRRRFWLDTCRDAREMQVGSLQVMEFHQNYGAGFFAPTEEQVQMLLDALDEMASTWDRDHPELFYEALKLNFPGLVRQAHAHAGGAG